MLIRDVGLQLYSLHEYTEKDFCGTVEKVAKMGYKGVEFAGYGGLKPGAVAQLLKDNGLTAYGSHIIYFISDGQPRWMVNVEDTLRGVDYSNWVSDMSGDYEVKYNSFGMGFVE